MKCGTSTLSAQLGAQQGIFITDPKEPNFFSDDNIYFKGQAWYENLFENASAKDIKGEASTHYTKLPTYPETLSRMTGMLDAPKIIYLIRDPITRAVSHYIHEWTMGVMSGEISEAFEHHEELVAYGRYAEQIAPFLDAFGQDSVFVLSLENLKRNPQEMLEQICTFLGYKGRPEWREDQARVNASADRFRRFPMHRLIFDNPLAASLRRALIPQAVRNQIKTSRQMRDRPKLPAEVRRRLEQEFARDYRRLRDLFPGRADLHASYPFVTDAN